MEWITPTTSKSKSTSSTSATSSPPPQADPVDPPKLDVYATKFVPGWLHQINSVPASRIFSPQPAYVNFEEYAQTFLPKPLYDASPSREFLSCIQNEWYALH